MVLWPRCHRWAWVASAWRHWGGRGVIGAAVAFVALWANKTPRPKALQHKAQGVCGVCGVLFLPWSGYQEEEG